MVILAPLVENLVAKLKGEKAYRVSAQLSDRSLLAIVRRRSIMLVRGLVRSVGLRRCGLPLFVGHRVALRHSSQIRLGRGVTIDDGALLDALSLRGITLGDSTSIGRYADLRGSGVFARPGIGIVIGRNVGVGPGCYIWGQGGVTIEDDVIIGPGVTVVSEDHNFTSSDMPIRMQGETRAAVLVQRGAWLGARAIILKGVTVGAGAVVAAGSVVNRDVPPGSVVGGVPARVLSGH